MKTHKMEDVMKENRIKTSNNIIKLSVKDRIVIRQLFPNESDLVTQLLVRDIIEKTEFTQEEIKKIGLKVNEKGYTWNPEAKEKEVDFTKAELEFLKSRVDEWDKKKRITQDILDLCIKIKDIRLS